MLANKRKQERRMTGLELTFHHDDLTRVEPTMQFLQTNSRVARSLAALARSLKLVESGQIGILEENGAVR